MNMNISDSDVEALRKIVAIAESIGGFAEATFYPKGPGDTGEPWCSIYVHRKQGDERSQHVSGAGPTLTDALDELRKEVSTEPESLRVDLREALRAPT